MEWNDAVVPKKDNSVFLHICEQTNGASIRPGAGGSVFVR